MNRFESLHNRVGRAGGHDESAVRFSGPAHGPGAQPDDGNTGRESQPDFRERAVAAIDGNERLAGLGHQTVPQTANSGGNGFYPSSTANRPGLESALRTAFSRFGTAADANHAAYIDFEVTDRAQNLPFNRAIQAQTNTDWAQYLETNLHGGGLSHPDDTYALVGTRFLRRVNGTARQEPGYCRSDGG